MHQLNIWTGVLMIILVVKLMDMIKVKFHSTLKIVFEAFSSVSSYLYAFSIIVLLLLFSFIFYAMLVMNYYSPGLESIGLIIKDVLLNIFQAGKTDPDSLSSIHYSSDSLVPILYDFILFITFNTFCFQFLLAMIVSSYQIIRAKYLLSIKTTVVYSEMVNTPITTKLMHLMTFTTFDKSIAQTDTKAFDMKQAEVMTPRTKATLDPNKGKDYYKYLVDGNTPPSKQKQNETRTLDRLKTSSQRAASFRQKSKVVMEEVEKIEDKSKANQPFNDKRTMKEIMFNNLELMGLMPFIDPNSIISRDIYLLKMGSIREKLIGQRALQMHRQVKELLSNVFVQFCKFLIYLIYITLYIMMITRHLDIVDRNSTLLGLRNDNIVLRSKNPQYQGTISFNDIVTISDVTYWSEVYLRSFPEVGEKFIRNSLYQVTNTQSFLTYLKSLLREKVLYPTDRGNDTSTPLVTHFIETTKVDVLGLYSLGDATRANDDIDLTTVGSLYPEHSDQIRLSVRRGYCGAWQGLEAQCEYPHVHDPRSSRLYGESQLANIGHRRKPFSPSSTTPKSGRCSTTTYCGVWSTFGTSSASTEAAQSSKHSEPTYCESTRMRLMAGRYSLRYVSTSSTLSS